MDLARQRRLPPSAQGGSLATVTNFGTFGLEWATPIPLPEQTLVLGMGAGRVAPHWDKEKGQFIPITEAHFTLSFDHRVLDGGGAGRLLQRIAALLQEPAKLVMRCGGHAVASFAWRTMLRPAIQTARLSRMNSSANRRAKERLAFQSSPKPSGGWAIPVRWLKNLCGVFLLPVAVVLTRDVFRALFQGGAGTVRIGRCRRSGSSSSAARCGAFGLWGACGRLVGRAAADPGLRLPGHELTHAIWVWMWGGRVSRFEVSREGGYILTDTHNFWIALAPYFYPIYSFVVILGFGIASVFCDFTRVENTFLFFTPVQWLSSSCSKRPGHFISASLCG